MANSLLNLRLLAVLSLLSLLLLPGCGDLTGALGGIEVSPTRITIGINQTQFFTALGRSGGGFLIAVTPTWSVNNSTIGTIRSSGLFTAGSLEATGRVLASDGTLLGSSEVTITKHGWLTGNVTDTNASVVVGIRVFLVEKTTLGDETDASGNYTIADIPAGTYTAAINPFGATQGQTFEVTIGEGQTVTQNFNPFTPTTTSTTTTLPF